MNDEIYNRAYEMIANGFEFGQIERGDTWERLIQGGPYSDIYTCAEKLKEEFGIKINVCLKYLKNAFDEYIQEYESEIYESKTKNTKNNSMKLNESQLRKIVAESVKRVLKEEYAGTDWFDNNPNKGMFSQEFENAIGSLHKALNNFINVRAKELEMNSNADARKDIQRMTDAAIKCLTTFEMYTPGIRTC